jgi:hypothetical protein
MPEELGNGAVHGVETAAEVSNAAPSVDEASIPSSAASEVASSTQAGTETAGAAAANAAGAAPPFPVPSGGAVPGYTPVREALKIYGLDLPEGVDDHAALQQLILGYRQAQQANQLAQYGQVYLQHADRFNEFLRQQQQAEASRQQQEQQKPWWSQYWSPPEFDKSWTDMIQRNEQGELTIRPGADPSVLPKFLAYQNFRRQQAERLMENPFKFFEEPVRALAREAAQEILQSGFQQQRETSLASDFVQRNSSWLHQRDSEGRLLYTTTQDGRQVPALTQHGQLFTRYVLEAQQRGMYDVQVQQDYATRMLERDVALAKLNQLQAGSQGEQQKQQFIQKHAAGAASHPQVAASVQNGVSQTTTRSSLADMLRQGFREAGITDRDFQPVGV